MFTIKTNYSIQRYKIYNEVSMKIIQGNSKGKLRVLPKEVNVFDFNEWTDYYIAGFYNLAEAKLWIAQNRSKVLSKYIIKHSRIECFSDYVVNETDYRCIQGEMDKNSKVINKIYTKFPELGI